MDEGAKLGFDLTREELRQHAIRNMPPLPRTAGIDTGVNHADHDRTKKQPQSALPMSQRCDRL
jgi:hypothetical protein